MRNKLLTKREKSAQNRIAWIKRAVVVNAGFFEAGFKSVPAVTAIAQNMYPNISNDDVTAFWNFRVYDIALLEKMENVLHKLKQE